MWRMALGIGLAVLMGIGTARGTPPVASGSAPHPPPVSAAPGEPQECVQDTLPIGARLRAMYFALDYEGAVVEGRRFIEETSGPGESRAWTLMSLASIYGEIDRAIAAAREWTHAAPEEPWAWFALAGTLAEDWTQRDQALPASRKAFRLARDHPDFIWLRAKILSKSDHAVAALNLIDRSLPRSGNAAQLLALKGEVLLSMSEGEKPNESMRSGAMRLFAKARQADPSNIIALYRPGVLLLHRHRLDEALPLLRRAEELSPCTTRIHGNLWSALMGRTDVPLEKKKADVEADIQELLRLRGHYPGALMAIAAQYGEMGFKTRQEELEKQILSDFPGSFQAEWVLVSRYTRFSRDHEADLDEPRVRNEYRKMLRAFIESPNHHMEGKLVTQAYQALFSTLRDDPAAKAEELVAVVRKIAVGRKDQLSEVAPDLACSLADRHLDLEEAERIVQEGMQNSRKEARSRRRYYISRNDRRFWLRFHRALLTDASGWVHVCQGKLKEGGVELFSAARQLARLKQPSEDNFFHLGKLAEAKGDLDEATKYYAEGMAVETPRKNPCEEAIRRLYVMRQGSLDGFEDYAEQFRKENRDKRKAHILAERIQQPEPIQAFSLKTLEGKRISSEELRGKVVVVKFWGVWCIWCIKEMPDFEKLFEKYRDDPEVAILTIDNDPNPETPREWIRKNGYKFPVLLDNDYVWTKAKIGAFPTTWFLDREGRKAFVKDGWSKELEEEFGWRIEALRAGKP